MSAACEQYLQRGHLNRAVRCDGCRMFGVAPRVVSRLSPWRVVFGLCRNVAPPRLVGCPCVAPPAQLEQIVKVQQVAEGLLLGPAKTGYVLVYVSKPLQELHDFALGFFGCSFSQCKTVMGGVGPMRLVFFSMCGPKHDKCHAPCSLYSTAAGRPGSVKFC